MSFHHRAKNLADLLARLASPPGAESWGSPPFGVVVRGPTDRPVRGLTHDSRAVARDWIFVALPGARFDGHEFVADLGDAAAVVVEREVETPDGVTVLRVEDTRRALPWLAAAFQGYPGCSIPVGGITGTNGKTTATWLCSAALRGAGLRGGIVGTTGHRAGGSAIDEAALAGAAFPHHTTPEAPLLQALLARMVEQGCDAVLMEVSSIGLDARRADAIPFAVAAFTNLTRDHLDYHGTMQAYETAKRRLFDELLPADGLALLNRDDPAWHRFVPAERRCQTYGLNEGDFHCEDFRLSSRGTTATVITPQGSGQLELPLVGRHNLSNALCALGMALALGAPLPGALAGLALAEPVPGRLEPVSNDRDLGIFVDYAHTPDALRHVLACLREIGTGRLITVFGCGGDRDHGKRAPMGAAARGGSDLVVVTSDNPRTEDPGSIIDRILEGIPNASEDPGTFVELDRARAIRRALQLARPGDLVLVAGKGHETTQDLGDRTIPFDDRRVARKLLEELA